MKTAAYEEARVPGTLTAERSGSTPSTAKRFRSMAFMFPRECRLCFLRSYRAMGIRGRWAGDRSREVRRARDRAGDRKRPETDSNGRAGPSRVTLSGSHALESKESKGGETRFS